MLSLFLVFAATVVVAPDNSLAAVVHQTQNQNQNQTQNGAVVDEWGRHDAGDDDAKPTRSGLKKPNLIAGYACTAVAVLFFGSNFIPVKKFESGDGLFYQAIMSTAILMVGMVVILIMSLIPRHDANGETYRHIPEFYPWGVFGGMLWATGNVMAVVVIKLIGLSIGLCIWSSSNMLMGWATGTFGLFKTPVNHVQYSWLNYIGVALACCSLVMYIFVKVESAPSDDDRRRSSSSTSSKALSSSSSDSAGTADEKEHADYNSVEMGNSSDDPLLTMDSSPRDEATPVSASGSLSVFSDLEVKTRNAVQRSRARKKARILQAIRAKTTAYLEGKLADSPHFTESEVKRTVLAYDLATEIKYDVLPDARPSIFDIIERQNVIVKKIVGIVIALGMGLLFGSTFTPVAYNINNDTAVSDNYLDFVFSHYCGIFFASQFWWFLYCAISCNRPRVFPKLVLPAWISGVMWAIAQTAWFVANGALGFSVAFPMITAGPGILASFWGIILFREIKGVRNYIVLAGAVFFTVASGICIGVSKGSAS
jgi:glucose uptake protein GlcU